MFNFIKAIFRSHPADHASEAKVMTSPVHRMQFSFLDKYELTYDNSLVFTGGFVNANDHLSAGDKLVIPATKRHPAYTLTVNGPYWQAGNGVSSMAIKFTTADEREKLSRCDFSNEIFYVEG